ncbi:BT0820 family HAD-type phosphatase [Labilibaculum sp.]|uniref:BT0820 family HAD-type phosphatase n=1 Tax=Labilibaculum sp. TaxID=2060723 RepID=UPI003565BB6C
MIIAVDFDGTIVEHKYPNIGREIPFAITSLKMLQENGHRIILWTYRAGKELEEAVQFCSSHGLEFYAVNKNYPEEVFDESISRKIKADMYIDDMNYGGLPDWGEIYAQIGAGNEVKTSRKISLSRWLRS